MLVEEENKHLAAITASASLQDSTEPVIWIEAPGAWPSLKLGELWEYRELIYFFGWRDIKVRYKQTILGAGWAIIQPLFTMLLFSLIFKRVAGVPSDGIHYPLFAFGGLVPWGLFSHGLNQASRSLVSDSSLIKKVYFPRLAIPIGKLLSALVDFGLALVLLFGMMFYYGVHPTLRVLWLPAFLVLALVPALGIAFWLSAINVRVRDVEHTLPFLTQIWLFATPIAYPSSLVPEPWRILYGINPMVGVVDGFRWALLGTKTDFGPALVVSSVVGVAMLVSGAFWFRRLEKTFADIL
jgi:homopolymeric O-antigen transport system permease protein